MGLVKPDSGRITLDGADITGLPMYRRAILGLGYLPQETSIFRGMTVEQNISAVLEMAEPDASARAARLETLLDEFGLGRLRSAPAMARPKRWSPTPMCAVCISARVLRCNGMRSCRISSHPQSE
jgi:lipopolysaccharide export system ATP-binding protein